MLKVKAISLISDAFNETNFFDTLAEVKKSGTNNAFCYYIYDIKNDYKLIYIIENNITYKIEK